MTYVFGPVPSRRLGLSLGVDLIPAKTCTYDCLYCEVGRTTSQEVEPCPHVPVEALVEEVRRKLARTSPDAITLAGSGEPTLHSGIDRIITSIRNATDIRIALLTNGSLFWRDDVRERVLAADIILPTLTTAREETFRAIHRPPAGLTLELVARGLKRLRQDFEGELFLEIMLLSGINDTESEITALKGMIAGISADRIQLNTVVRPPADRHALPVDPKRLEEIRAFIGGRAEIVAEFHPAGGRSGKESPIGELREMLRRRPLRLSDIEAAMGLSGEEAEDMVKALLMKGSILRRIHAGDTYYLSNERYDG